MKLSKLP